MLKYWKGVLVLAVVLLFVLQAAPVAFSQGSPPTPTPRPDQGALCVSAAGEASDYSEQVPKLIILDTTGSMQAIDNETTGQTRFDLAVDGLRSYLNDVPDNTPIGLRDFTGSSCSQGGQIRVPIDTGNRTDLLNTLETSQATQPIDYLSPNLIAAEEDFDASGYGSGPKEVLLVADGGDQCNNDPVAVARNLVDQDPDLRIFVLGFDVEPNSSIESVLQEIADAGNGAYIPVGSGDSLSRALGLDVRVSYQVYQEGSSSPIYNSVANYEAQYLMSGTYEVSVPTRRVERQRVEIRRGRGTTLFVDEDGDTRIDDDDGACYRGIVP
ncbi:MAG: VWA domain-containing protein, partial [Chloroflexi bacterium]|nr:VWA domain-containing protein [Chloroflexota bacterium]